MSADRTAGVITFDDDPIVRIRLDEKNTANFKGMVNSIPYRGRGTDVLEGLEEAFAEIKRNSPTSLYLVGEYFVTCEFICMR